MYLEEEPGVRQDELLAGVRADGTGILDNLKKVLVVSVNSLFDLNWTFSILGGGRRRRPPGAAAGVAPVACHVARGTAFGT